MIDRDLEKKDVQESIGGEKNTIRKYQDFFVGNRSTWSLIKYEIAHMFASPMPGGLGYVLRKTLLTSLLGSTGNGVQIGRSVALRHPGKMSIGDRTAIDDFCVLDARGVEDGPFKIGREVIIARNTALTSKSVEGSIVIGDHCTVGKNCILSSTSGIQIGSHVAIAGSCYLGGGRYRNDRTDIPILKQGLYTRGPVVVGEDCWIGTGARILDGITIGRGSVIGAGTVVHKDVPEYTTVMGYQPLHMESR
jgi:acetyltransferase-like isoleucine patch superfamily enzyme